MSTEYTWKGPTGFNPLVGYVTQDNPVMVVDEKIKSRLLSAALIEPIQKNPEQEVKDGTGDKGSSKEERPEAESENGEAGQDIE